MTTIQREEVSNHGRKWNEKRKIQLVPGHE